MQANQNIKQFEVALLMDDISEAKEVSDTLRDLGIYAHFYDNLDDYWVAASTESPDLTIVDIKKMSSGKILFKNHPKVDSIIPLKEEEGARNSGIFPHDPNYNWNNDYFGNLYIPEKGATVDLNLNVLPIYKRIITEYENNTLQVKGNQIFVNGALATNYTFKQNYYWLMGDNRHDSQDSRTWGFVPFDHVVGKPVFIWFSFDSDGIGLKNKIRWDRLFTTVGGSGERVSYLIPFIVLLLGWFGYGKWKNRKEANS